MKVLLSRSVCLGLFLTLAIMSPGSRWGNAGHAKEAGSADNANAEPTEGAASETAEKKTETQSITLADGQIGLSLPADWKEVKPRVRIIEKEFEIPGKDGADPARLTIMRAGGSVQANVDRWLGQFEQTQDQPSTETTEAADGKLHRVRVSGRYKDQAGPFAPPVMRDQYRLDGAILETKQQGNYFFKLIGPSSTVEAHAEAWSAALKSLELKQ